MDNVKIVLTMKEEEEEKAKSVDPIFVFKIKGYSLMVRVKSVIMLILFHRTKDLALKFPVPIQKNIWILVNVNHVPRILIRNLTQETAYPNSVLLKKG